MIAIVLVLNMGQGIGAKEYQDYKRGRNAIMTRHFRDVTEGHVKQDTESKLNETDFIRAQEEALKRKLGIDRKIIWPVVWSAPKGW